MKTTTLCILLACLLLFAAPLTTHAGDDDRAKLIDVTFEDTPVRKAITKLADMAGANIIMSPKVKGSVTVKLQGVAWREALDMIAQSTGSVVIEEDFGILRVVPAAEARPSNAKRELASAAKLARAHATLAELEAKLAKATAEKHRDEVQLLTERLARLRTDIAESRARAARAAAVRALGTAKVTEHGVTIYDTRDFRAEQLEQLLLKFRREGADIRLTNGQLIVRTGPATQKELANVIEQARKRNAAVKRELVLDFGKPKVMRKMGKVTMTKSGRYRVKLDSNGRIIEEELIPDDADELYKVDTVTVGGKRYKLPRVAQTDPQIAAARKRVENLTAALKHLKAAGVKQQAQQVQAQIAAAKIALERAIAARERRERARQPAEKVHDVWGQALRLAGAKNAPLQASIQALRKDVNGLRQEVRELTGLVRKLLEQRER